MREVGTAVRRVTRLPLSAQRFMRALMRAPVLAVALALALLGGISPAWPQATAPGPVAAAAKPAGIGLRLRPWAGPVPPLAEQVLSADERAFIAQLPEIRVAVPSPSPRPYETVSDDGEVSGIHPDMLAYLANALGLRLRPVGLPSWTATLEAAQRREVDLLMTLGVTPERSAYLAFTLGATPLPGALYGRRVTAGGPARPGQADARYAVERGYLAGDFIRRQYPLATLHVTETPADALAAVAHGKADYYIGSLLETEDLLRRKPLPALEMLQLVHYGTGYYHFGVRKDWQPLVTILNKGITILRTTPPPELAAALSALNDRVALPRPTILGPGEAARLIDKPIWRIGAVRGLRMLNDIDADGQHSGIAAEYAEQLAQHLGVGLHVIPFDHAGDMLAALRDGRIDLVPFLTRTPAREREFRFSQPYLTMPHVLVARSDAPLYWGLDSLRGRRLALAEAHPLRDHLAQHHPDIEIVTTPTGNAAMDAVADGRADAAVEVKLFANLRINGDNDGRLRAVGEVAELPAQFHFAAGPSGAPLIPIVDRVLGEIAQGERDRILRRWVAVDLRPGIPWNRYAPWIALALAVLVLAAGLTAFWMRRLQREVAERRRSEERLADIGAQLPCIAFRYVLDDDRRLQGPAYYSPGATPLLGERLDDRLSLIDNLAPRLRGEHLSAARRLEGASLAGGERLRFIAAYAHPDGRERWLHVEAVARRPHEAPGSRLTTWTGYVVDITAERELQDRVEREAQARNLMLASASHELRAPTHTLSLALQTLAQSAPEPARATALTVAQDAVRNLGQLLNDVLDAARLDRGELHLRPQVFSPRELVEQIRLEVQAWADHKGLAFRVEIASAVPPIVQLDPLRLRQILTNLLGNAIKYTPAGSVELAVGMQPGQGGDAWLLCEVRDSGPGIAPERQVHLFAPYAAADPAALPVPEGSTGLGLSISRRLARMMGGDLSLSSEPGHGTRVRLRVPLPPAAPPPSPGALLRSGSIVLCEDDPTCLLLMAQMLRGHGYAVIECTNALQALQTWRSGGVSAVVTDLHMDGMDGITLVQRIRSEMAGRPTRLLVCSGNPVPAFGAGDAPPYDAWLTKPVQMSVLLGALANLGLPAPASDERRATAAPPA